MKATREESWLVRILDASGATVGSGFLIGTSTVLTCAHVVSDAIRTRPGSRPRDYVALDLPAFQQQRQAGVIPGGWFPGHDPDLAVLTLQGPALRTDPPRMRAGDPGAVAVPLPQWQLPVADWTERAGYSGMPCLDSAGGEIVGMVTSGDPGTPELSWRVLPASVIAGYWPPAADPVALAASSAARSAGIGLAIRDVGAVVEALLDFPDLRDQRLRSLYIDLIAERTGVTADLERYPDARRDLWSLAAWCSRAFGGFTELLAVIRDFHPASVEAEALIELVERVAPPPLLRHEERASLEALARDASRRVVVESATEAMGVPPAFATDAAGDEASIVRWLEDGMPPPGQAPPVVEFAARLAESSLVGYQRARLRRWVDGVTGRLGTPAPQAATAVEAVALGGPALYLTFQVAEDFHDRGTYQLRAWSQRRGRQRHVIYLGDELLPLAEVKAEVGRLAQQAIPDPVAGDDTFVEFVLPDSLLNLPVEHWRVGSGAQARSLGETYPVVVRSLEHPPDPLLRAIWAERWRHLIDASDHAPAHDIVRAPFLDVARPEDEWARELRRIANYAVPYLDNADSPQLRAAVRAGVPVVVWSRKPDGDVPEARLPEELDEGSPTDLPLILRRLRQQAAGSDASGHVGHRMAIIWDDPARVTETGTFLREPALAEED